MIERIGASVGKQVTLTGWVYNKRSSGKVRFLILRDGTGVIQSVFLKGQVPADEIVTHEFPLEQHNEAFQMVLEAKESIKVMLKP